MAFFSVTRHYTRKCSQRIHPIKKRDELRLRITFLWIRSFSTAQWTIFPFSKPFKTWQKCVFCCDRGRKPIRQLSDAARRTENEASRRAIFLGHGFLLLLYWKFCGATFFDAQERGKIIHCDLLSIVIAESPNWISSSYTRSFCYQGKKSWANWHFGHATMFLRLFQAKNVLFADFSQVLHFKRIKGNVNWVGRALLCRSSLRSSTKKLHSSWNRAKTFRMSEGRAFWGK